VSEGKAAGDPGDRPPRSICPRCTRPQVVCVCALAPALQTRTQVMFLQHPRERRMAIGTARLAHLGLPGSVLRVGLDFSNDKVVQAALAAQPVPHVLFPGEHAIDVHDLPPDSAISLIVLDGTWSQAKKLLRLNPALAALPRLAFSPRRPSEYQIRRQPADYCVSTIEALGEVLAALEPTNSKVVRLLDPFFAMVARQQRFAQEVHSSRHRRAADRLRRDPAGLAFLRAPANLRRIVCVHGEANAWPLRHPAWQPAEIVHWLAHRLETNESYQAVLRPRRTLAPSVLHHLGLGEADLAQGLDVAAWKRSWDEFRRPDDLLVFWGTFPRDVARLDQLDLGAEVIDLRSESSQWFHRKAGPVEAMAALMGASVGDEVGVGRGGQRLATLMGLLREIARNRPLLPR
jgi:DTW domain-containing protein YfiP